jgi:GxxExxY protein
MDLDVKRQAFFVYDSIESSEGLRLDLLVADCNSIEVKVVELLNPVWDAQIISHLRLLTKDLGSSINKMTSKGLSQKELLKTLSLTGKKHGFLRK